MYRPPARSHNLLRPEVAPVQPGTTAPLIDRGGSCRTRLCWTLYLPAATVASRARLLAPADAQNVLAVACSAVATVGPYRVPAGPAVDEVAAAASNIDCVLSFECVYAIRSGGAMDAISFAAPKTAARRERVHAAAGRLHRPEGAAELGRALCSGGPRVEHEVLAVRRQAAAKASSSLSRVVRLSALPSGRSTWTSTGGERSPFAVYEIHFLSADQRGSAPKARNPRLAATVATDLPDAREVHLFAGETGRMRSASRLVTRRDVEGRGVGRDCMPASPVKVDQI
jgi:hypothetical protein